MKTIFTLSSLLLTVVSFGQNFLTQVPILQIESSGIYPNIDAIASDDQYVYAISGSVGEIARSSDGITWDEFMPSSSFAEYRALESNGTTLYAYDQGFGGTPSPRILKSTDNGNNFSTENTGYIDSPLSPYYRSKLYFVDNNWWITNGNSNESPYRLNSSTNTWEQMSGIPGCSNICSAGGELFAITELHEFKKSSDDGATWNDVTLTIQSSFKKTLKSYNDTLYLIAREVISGTSYLSVSGDGGSTWDNIDLTNYVNTGNLGVNQFDAIDIDENQIVLSATDNSNQDTNMRLIQSYDRGSTFTEHLYGTHTLYGVVREIYLRNDDIFLLYDDYLYSTLGTSGGSGGGTASLSEEIMKNATIYPNPAKSNLTLRNFDPNEKIQILNLIGQEMSFERIGNQINIESFPAGTYIVKQGAIRLKFQKQ